MIQKLPPELLDALHASEHDAVELIDPTNNRVYVVIDEERYRQAMETLKRQSDLAAIKEGVRQMEAGDAGMTVEEVREWNRRRLLSGDQ